MSAHSRLAFICALFAVPALAHPLPAQESNRIRVSELVRTVTSRVKSQEQRDEAERALKQLDAATVLEIIFPEMERLFQEPAPEVPGYFVPQDKLPHSVLAIRALHGIWMHFFWDDSGANHGSAILPLLKTVKLDGFKRGVIYGLGRHFVPEAEAPLAAFLRGDNFQLRLAAAESLLKCLPKKYGPELVAIVADEKMEVRHRVEFFNVLWTGSFKLLDEKTRSAMIRASFALIEAQQRRATPANPDAGYFTAAYLARHLDVRFAPDPHDPKYRTPNGVSEAYFTHTVANALAWWNKHGQEYK